MLTPAIITTIITIDSTPLRMTVSHNAAMEPKKAVKKFFNINLLL